MVHSVELIFDPETETVVRGIWDALRDKDIPSQAPASRPHATLTVAQRIDADADAALRELTDRFPIECRLGATLIFGRSAGVLARLLVPTGELLDLQAEAYRRCLPFLVPAPMPHAEPGQWTPHVTLARRIAPARLTTAVRIAGRPAEIAGHAVGLRHWDGDKRVEHLIG
ncbi:2'-5' RNA ligase family protein [Mycobacterium sp. TNTM28]|uniref:2'-5' RNA ligase family protein n=1 Tax=[Mycobacterium] fortunisiensis TaxID=2600579 RepID=A0ABS6KNC0_9MYCO|nr:2'-5' RNA ligase family protein [[Mycobacterium] fortunisiensis]MBU9765008.1 2'-5' RNA ligase family protein [[Mycobacterium] fortunisiensis]